jgi:hypothetical protein
LLGLATVVLVAGQPVQVAPHHPFAEAGLLPNLGLPREAHPIVGGAFGQHCGFTSCRTTKSPPLQEGRIFERLNAPSSPSAGRFQFPAPEAVHEQERSVPASVQVRVPKGLAVAIYGLNGLLPTGQVAGVRRSTPSPTVDDILRERLGQEIQVQLLRMDPDSGRIFVSERVAAGRQLTLF